MVVWGPIASAVEQRQTVGDINADEGSKVHVLVDNSYIGGDTKFTDLKHLNHILRPKYSTISSSPATLDQTLVSFPEPMDLAKSMYINTFASQENLPSNSSVVV